MAEKLTAFFVSAMDMSTGVENLRASLETQDEQLLQLIRVIENHDELYTTGVGKSAIVAKYAADILSSVGFPTHFVDPFGAMHGDLGRIMYAAPIIVFSNSGATEDLLPLLKAVSYRNHIIFVTGQEDYPFKEKYAEISINTGPHVEGNLLNFPGSSVVNQIMFCAALTAELVERNNVTRDDYRIFHPGGAIGKRLSDLRDEDV